MQHVILKPLVISRTFAAVSESILSHFSRYHLQPVARTKEFWPVMFINRLRYASPARKLWLQISVIFTNFHGFYVLHRMMIIYLFSPIAQDYLQYSTTYRIIQITIGFWLCAFSSEFEQHVCSCRWVCFLLPDWTYQSVETLFLRATTARSSLVHAVALCRQSFRGYIESCRSQCLKLSSIAASLWWSGLDSKTHGTTINNETRTQ